MVIEFTFHYFRFEPHQLLCQQQQFVYLHSTILDLNLIALRHFVEHDRIFTFHYFRFESSAVKKALIAASRFTFHYFRFESEHLYKSIRL